MFSGARVCTNYRVTILKFSSSIYQSTAAHVRLMREDVLIHVSLPAYVSGCENSRKRSRYRRISPPGIDLSVYVASV